MPAEGPLPDVRGKRVAVVGGGDVAIDVARSSLRMGAREVHVIYRRAGDDMPAAHLPEEIEAARHEGIRFHTLVNPVEVLGNGSVAGVRLQQQRLADFDDTARRRPVPLGADAYVLDVEVLIPAIGQVPDLTWLHGSDIARGRGDTFVVDEAYATTRPGVFAAGDAVSGPATIVEAVAQGNLVAAAVDHWLRTGELVKPHLEAERTDVPCATIWRRTPSTTGPRPRVCRWNARREFPRSGTGIRRGGGPRGSPPLPAVRPGVAGRDETASPRRGEGMRDDSWDLVRLLTTDN